MRPAALAAVFWIPAVLCALWTVAAGKDVNWDLLNYHYYGPYEWLGARLGQDYFAASGQSYLNPAGHVPFYLMVSAGWHSVAVSMLLAAAHGLSLSLLYLIAWKLFAHHAPRERHMLSALATAAGAATAIFWALVGSTFLDPLLAVPMLAGLLALLGEAPQGAVRRAALAGLLFGLAAALKYSNAMFALAALPLALAAPQAAWRARLAAGAAYAAGGAAAVAAFAGPWLALMWREMGNPVFPLMNGWFRSPHAPAANMFAGRFELQDAWSALALPFRLAVPDGMLYAEIIAPDMRFVALLAALVALPIAARLGRRASPGWRLSGADYRVLGYFSAALAVWLLTSVNARYGVMVLLLAGLCLARLVERALPLPAARIALAALLVVQLGASLMVAPARWALADRWSASWLPFAPAEPAVREPALYLTIETLPMAAVAPFVHRDASFVNLRGQYSIPPGSPRLQSLLERHAGKVRALGRHLRIRENGRPREEAIEAYDYTYIRYGYRIDPADCHAIDWRPDEQDALSRAANWLARQPGRHEEVLSLGSCALRPARRDPRDVEAERRVTEAFERIERACPKLFRGQTALTESLGKEWMRNYPALDARLETQGDIVILDRYLALSYFNFGSLAAWQRGQGTLPAPCR
jgi:hypothetical protein